MVFGARSVSSTCDATTWPAASLICVCTCTGAGVSSPVEIRDLASTSASSGLTAF